MDFKKVAVWTVTIFVAAVMLLAGAGKLVQPEQWQQRFAGEWGLPGWMALVTGVAEITGAVLLLAPRSAVYGGALVTAVMLGAFGTHVLAGQLTQAPVPLVFAALAALVSWYRCPWCGGD